MTQIPDLSCRLSTGSYLGRGIFLGLSEDRRYAIQVFWIEARQSAHQHREFHETQDEGVVWVRCSRRIPCHDPHELEYPAMASRAGLHVVSNGPQTMLLADRSGERDIERALCMATVEAPGDPRSPRITGATDLRGASPAHLLFAATVHVQAGDRLVSAYACDAVPPGCGYCITTYSGCSTAPVSFGGKPHLLRISGAWTDLVDVLWASMPADLRVGVLLKKIDLATGAASTRWRSRGL
jgi:hypothetical protein